MHVFFPKDKMNATNVKKTLPTPLTRGLHHLEIECSFVTKQTAGPQNKCFSLQIVIFNLFKKTDVA